MVIRITPVREPPGKLADVELHFRSGDLSGLKLVGFSIWSGRNGQRKVSFPARQYEVRGEKRSYAILRPIVDVNYQDALSDKILEAYARHAVTEVV